LRIRNSCNDPERTTRIKQESKIWQNPRVFPPPQIPGCRQPLRRNRIATRYCAAARHLAPQLHTRSSPRCSPPPLTIATQVFMAFAYAQATPCTVCRPTRPSECSRLYANVSSPLRWLTATSHEQQPACSLFNIAFQPPLAAVRPDHRCTQLLSHLYANVSSPLRWHTATSHTWPARSPHSASPVTIVSCTNLTRCYHLHSPPAARAPSS